jgi:hypothetical protein
MLALQPGSVLEAVNQEDVNFAISAAAASLPHVDADVDSMNPQGCVKRSDLGKRFAQRPINLVFAGPERVERARRFFARKRRGSVAGSGGASGFLDDAAHALAELTVAELREGHAPLLLNQPPLKHVLETLHPKAGAAQKPFRAGGGSAAFQGDEAATTQALPAAVVRNILSYVPSDAAFLARCATVCRSWRRGLHPGLGGGGATALWSEAILRQSGTGKSPVVPGSAREGERRQALWRFLAASATVREGASSGSGAQPPSGFDPAARAVVGARGDSDKKADGGGKTAVLAQKK